MHNTIRVIMKLEVKIMKKIFSTLCSIILVSSLVTLAINISIQNMAIDTIHNSIVKKKISNIVTDVIIKTYPNIAISDLEGLNKVLQDSPESKEITKKYFENIMDEITNEDTTIPVEIETDLEKLIDHHREELANYGIDLDKIDTIKEEIIQDNNMTEIYEIVRDRLPTQLTKEQQLIVNGYQMIHSKTLEYILLGIIILSSIGIILMNWHSKSYLKYLGFSTLVSGMIIHIVLIGAIKWISWEFTNHILGRTTEINYASLSWIGLSYLGVGIILLTIFIVLKKTSHSTTS